MGACTIPGKLMIVTELMPRNLESVFLGKAGKRVALVQKLKMAKDAALGTPLASTAPFPHFYMYLFFDAWPPIFFFFF
jgi:hypothetical protein